MMMMMGGSRIQERTGSAKKKLERCSQERPTKTGSHLGRGRGSGRRQTRTVSECTVVQCIHMDVGQIISWSKNLHMSRKLTKKCCRNCTVRHQPKLQDHEHRPRYHGVTIQCPAFSSHNYAA